MFYSIPINYDSQHKTNFWWNGSVFKMCRLPMGVKNDVYIAQKAALLVYSDGNLTIFLQEKGIKKGSEQFSFYSVSQFLLIYLDNLCLFTPKRIKDANRLHLFLIEYLLYCTI